MAQVSLKCSQCNGDMTFDNNRKVFVCKYCGNVETIDESDDVQIQRLKSQTYRDVEATRQQTELKKEQMYYDQINKMVEDEQRKKNMIWWVLGWIFFFPAPLTILIWKNQNLDTKTKGILIGVLWAVLLIITVVYESNNAVLVSPML